LLLLAIDICTYNLLLKHAGISWIEWSWWWSCYVEAVHAYRWYSIIPTLTPVSCLQLLLLLCRLSTCWMPLVWSY
jgi:hypothetical protein